MDSRATRPNVDPRTTLALWLRAGRTQSRLSLDEVARVTKIQPRILEQLETGQFDGLPAEVFVRGFVKSFARCVGLNEVEALKRYVACAGSPSSATARAFIETLVAVPVRARMASGTLPPPLPTPVSGEAAQIPAAVTRLPAPAAATPEPCVVTRSAEPIGRTKKRRGRRRKELRTKKMQGMANHGDPGGVAQSADSSVNAGVASGSAQSADSSVSAIANSSNQCATSRSIAPAPPGRAALPMRECGVGSIAPAPPGRAALPMRECGVGSMGSVVVAQPEDAAVGVVNSADSAMSGTLDGVLSTSSVRSTASAAALHSASRAHKDGGPANRDVAAVEGKPVPRSVVREKSSQLPWRRPTSVGAKSATPSLVIDDADPELADMQREAREAAQKPGPQRVSFLPPILLDRDERGGRQGGLTLAVILLLIAATLTLSYLMRRPSLSGDGVTSNAIDGTTVAALVR